MTGLRLTMKAIRDIRHLGPSRLDLLRRAGLVLLHPREHIALTRILAQEPVAALTRQRPRLLYKYVWPYLARRFSPDDRRAILASHHRFLQTSISPRFIPRLLQGRIPLWSFTSGATMCAIALDRVGYPDTEGELEAQFIVDGERVYRLAFSIVPGTLLGEQAEHVLFVGGVQGVVGQFAAIRLASRLCDAPPARLLLDAAIGIARALGIELIVGVSDAEQVSKVADPTPEFTFSYDRFFLTAGGALRDGLFHLPAVLPDDSVAEVRSQRRGRSRAHRAFRRGVSEAAEDVLQRECVV